VRERIAQLRQRVRDVDRTRGLHRHERAAVPFPTVALVGYTNAGKSTLMNTLTRAGVLVEDRLFATLDPTIRRLRLPGGLTVLVADTVGFIHKLPHQLVDAFKSTLEEVRSAELLVHVVDVAHPTWAEQCQVVESVLAEIGAEERPVVRALNKVTGEGLPQLLAAIETRLTRGLERVRYALPSARGDVIALLRRAGRILEEYHRDGTVTVTALVPPKVAGQLRPPAAARPC
jgi:GTP-binding protein HflX